MGTSLNVLRSTPPIQSLLIKPASALCNLDCDYCFYLDRDTDPYKDLQQRRMSIETLKRLTQGFIEYSYPNSVFAFQGGEPTLAGLDFFTKLCEFQVEFGQRGQSVSNAMQTNGTLIDSDWCALFKEYAWLIGVSMDGPPEIHDFYRLDKGRQGSWKKVMRGIEAMQAAGVEFNVLCVLNNINVTKPRELYKYFRKLGVENLQFIPLAEFDLHGKRLPFAITAEQYGRFLTEIFDIWFPERKTVRIRFFDNLAEALAGQKPGTCTMHTSCDSYAVVEYNGDVYPCDFFVSDEWKLGNVMTDTWQEISTREHRFEFANKKKLPHEECVKCEYRQLCHGGCPSFRFAPRGQFEDLDYFCQSYKMAFKKAIPPLRDEVRKLMQAAFSDQQSAVSFGPARGYKPKS